MTAPTMETLYLTVGAVLVISFLILLLALYLISRHPMVRKRYLSQIVHFHGLPESPQSPISHFPKVSPCEASLLTADAATVVVLMVLALLDKKVLKVCQSNELYFEVTGEERDGCDSLEKAFLSLVEHNGRATGTALHRFLKEVSLSLSRKVWPEDKLLLRKILEDRAQLMQEIVKERGSISRSEELQWALIPEAGRNELYASLSGSGPEISFPALFSGVLQHLSCVRAFWDPRSIDLLTIFGYRGAQEEEPVIASLQLPDRVSDRLPDHHGDHLITGEEITASVKRAGASLRRNFEAFRSMITGDVSAHYIRIICEISKYLDDHFDELPGDDQEAFEHELMLRREEGQELESYLNSRILQNEKDLAEEEERVDFRDDIKALNPELEKRESELRLKRDMEARQLFAARVERESLSSLWSRIICFRRVKELRHFISAQEEVQREIQRSLWEVRALWEKERRAHLSECLHDMAQWALCTTERALLKAELSFLRSAPESFFRECALSELLTLKWKASPALGENLLKEYAVLREKRDSYHSVTCIFSALNEWLQNLGVNLGSSWEKDSSLKSQYREQYDTLQKVLKTIERNDMTTFDEYVCYFSNCDEERGKIIQSSPQIGGTTMQVDEC